ncbi:SIR2 family protein [Bacillus halotolerans]|uniref:SIR2 family protein n=1 Tax=Bacillus halotolerans TaxID=260554 RepID=UPI0018F1F28F|nr:SIR2 family protein [Bacillus halotolerans]MBJ7570386.1 SIR2 family protein [Bacillus halotolerans]MEC3637399.1 SIR2 family protein [Bacillus halotolerans]
MLFEWPDNLVTELAHKRCVIFLGAGISATAKNKDGNSPLTWGRFISEIKSISRGNSLKYIDEMIAQQNYLPALQAIYDDTDPGRYSSFLKDKFQRPGFLPSPVHEAIKELNSKIVVTTNFDKIYDGLCSEHGYIIANYNDPIGKMVSTIKSPENLVIKAHGTIDDIDNLVFTEKQYYDAKARYPEFYQILNALFLTHTVVFLGYSLNDPDINLLLETASNSISKSSPHYVVIEEGAQTEKLKYWQDCYNIYALEYGPDYTHLPAKIEELKNLVATERIEKSLPQ